MKYILTFLVLAGLGAGGYFYWKQKSNSKPVPEQAQQRVVTAKVEARDISFAVTSAGDIGPADQVSVRPEVNGRIAELPLDIGDKVKKGQLMCRLDDQDLQIEKDQRLTEIKGAKLQIEGTQLQLTKAERDFDRNKELFEKNLISKETFENQRTELELTRNQIQVAKNALERTDMVLRSVEDRITKTKLMAPFDCTVLTRPVSLGQTVSGAAGFNAGTEIMSIANLNDMVVNAHINQADVIRLSATQPVDIQVESLPGVKMKGLIERIAPQATIKNGIKGFAARIEIKEMDARVRPGMTATLTIPIAMADNVVAVPLAAVFTEDGERFVFLKKEETFEKRNVQIGVTDYQFAEIQQGVKVGEEVFIEPPKEALAQLSGKEGKDKDVKSSKEKEKDGKGNKAKSTVKAKESSATKPGNHGT
jgi:HlyD family secretion protein